MNPTAIRSFGGAAALLATLAVVGAAGADDLYGPFATPHTALSAFAGAVRTDNATQVPGGPADTIETVGVSASVYRANDVLRFDLDGSVQQADYHDHTYAGQTIGHGGLDATYNFVPQLFVWTLQDSYGQALLNPLQPGTPLNRIDANYGSTGPDFDFKLGGGTDLLLGARYARADFETNPLAPVSNHSVSGDLGVREALSATSAVSLMVDSSRVEYQAPGTPRYDTLDAYVHFDTRGARTGLTLDVGASQARESGATARTPLARLAVFRRLTPSWNLNLSLSDQVQNSGQQLQSALSNQRVLDGQRVSGTPTGGGAGVPAPVDILLAQTPFRVATGTLSLDFLRPRTSLDLSAGASRTRAELGSSIFDRDTVQGAIAFGRRLRPTLEFHASGSYERRTPVSAAVPGDRTTTASAGLDWHPGHLLSVELIYWHEDRRADLAGAPYVVNLTYLGLRYGAPRPVIAFATAGPGMGGAPTP